MGAPQTLPANFNGWDQAPATLPADFDKWDQPKATAPAPQPGFGGRFAQSLGIPTNMEELQSALQHSSGLGALLGYGTNLYERGKDFAQNPSLKTGFDAGFALTPGGALQKSFAEDVVNKNYSGAAGTAAGVGLQFAAPELIDRGSKTFDIATSKARGIYDALPDDLQSDLQALAKKGTGIVSPRLRSALEFWDTAKRIREHLQGLADAAKKSTESELDATGENKPYAGEPPPKAPRWNAYDATGENKPFAGGMDEWSPPKPAATAIPPRADPFAQSSSLGQIPARPGAAGSMAQSVAAKADPLLTRLRTIAADIEAQDREAPSAAKTTVEDDLTPLLLESLKQVRAARASSAQ